METKTRVQSNENVICPKCNYVVKDSEMKDEKKKVLFTYKCPVCSADFNLIIRTEINFITTLKV